MPEKKPFLTINVVGNGFETIGITAGMIEQLQTKHNIHLVKTTPNNAFPEPIGYIDATFTSPPIISMNKNAPVSSDEILAILNI